MESFAKEDTVSRVNSRGVVEFGLVERCEGESDSESDDCDGGGYSLRPGQLVVSWHTTRGTHVQRVAASKVTLVDRSLLPGNVVRRLHSPATSQMGVCLWNEMKASVRVCGTSVVLTGVAGSQLLPPIRFSTDSLVCLNSWLGEVVDVNTEVTLKFDDGSLCVLTDLQMIALRHTDRYMDQVLEQYFYPGEQLEGAMHCFSKARWLHCTCALDILKRRKTHMAKVTVLAQRVTSVRIEWKMSTENSCCPPEVISGDTLDEVRMLDMMAACSIEVGGLYQLTVTADHVTGACTLNSWQHRLREDQKSMQPVASIDPADAPSGRQKKSHHHPRRSANRGRLRRSSLKPDRNSQQAQLQKLTCPGETILVQVLATSSSVDIIWQDGSEEKHIPSVKLQPMASCENHEFFPGDYVASNKSNGSFTGMEYGVVQFSNHSDRTVAVKWYSVDGSGSQVLLGDEELSVYDVLDHKLLSFEPGTVVFSHRAHTAPTAINFHTSSATKSSPNNVIDEPAELEDLQGKDEITESVDAEKQGQTGELVDSERKDQQSDLADSERKDQQSDLADSEKIDQLGQLSDSEGKDQPGQSADTLTNQIQTGITFHSKTQTVDADQTSTVVDATYIDTDSADRNRVASFVSTASDDRDIAVPVMVGRTRRVLVNGWVEVLWSDGTISSHVPNSLIRYGTPDDSCDEDSSDCSSSTDSSEWETESEVVTVGVRTEGSEVMCESDWRGLVQRLDRLMEECSNGASAESAFAQFSAVARDVWSETYGSFPSCDRLSSLLQSTDLFQTSDTLGSLPTAEGRNSDVPASFLPLMETLVKLFQKYPASLSVYAAKIELFCATHNLPSGFSSDLINFLQNSTDGISGESTGKTVGASLEDTESTDCITEGHLETSSAVVDQPQDISTVSDIASPECSRKTSSSYGGFVMMPEVHQQHRFLNTTCSPVKPDQFARAVSREIRLLSTSLPDGILVRGYEDRMDLLSVMICGPLRTPYEGGVFYFDVHLSPNHPASPPTLHYINFSDGGALNPNLYPCGRVCVSLLGTWAGRGSETWSATNSSILQLLVSIQGLILVAEPYFNEAGYEKQRGSDVAAQNSRSYNEMVLLRLVQAMCAVLDRPPTVFFDETIHYLRGSLPQLVSRLQRWLDFPGDSHSSSEPRDELLPEFPLFPLSRGFRLSLLPELDHLIQKLRERCWMPGSPV